MKMKSSINLTRLFFRKASLFPIRLVIVFLLMIIERTHSEKVASSGPLSTSPERIARAMQLTEAVKRLRRNPRKITSLRFSAHVTLVRWLNKVTLHVIELPEKLFLAGPGPRSTDTIADAIRISSWENMQVAIKEGTISDCKVVVGSQGIHSKELRSEVQTYNENVVFVTAQASWQLVDPSARLLLASNPRYIFHEGHPNTLVTFIFFCIVDLEIVLEVDGISLYVDCDERGIYSNGSTPPGVQRNFRHHDPLNNFALMQGLKDSILIADSCLSKVLDLSPDQYIATLSSKLT